MNVNDDKSVSIVLPVPQEESDAESLRLGFNNWKETVPLANQRRWLP